MEIRDRVTDLRRVRAGDLEPHPENWREHPDHQIETMRDLLEQVGYSDALLAYEPEPGHLVLLDGHMRQALDPDQEVPVLVVDLTEDEAKLVLATHDPVASLAGSANVVLERLLNDVHERSAGAMSFLERLREDTSAALAMDSHMGKDDGGFWAPKIDSATGEHATDYVGYDLGSVWWETVGDGECRAAPYILPLPANPGKAAEGRLFGNYSRSPLCEMERIVRTYMVPGDRFLEVCAGWWTFSATAAVWGMSGAGIDIWDVSVGFGRKQMKALPASAGTVEVRRGDALALPYDDDEFDIAYCNPPFYQLERYSDAPEDLAAKRTSEEWLDASGRMMAEMGRVVRSGGLIVTVMADYRVDGILEPLGARWILEGVSRGLLLHDVVIQRMLSQQIRMWRKAWTARRTAKAHEYVIVFRNSGEPPRRGGPDESSSAEREPGDV